MIVKMGETKSETIRESTLDGILFNVYIFSAVVNAPYVPGSFIPAEVTLKVELKRKKSNVIIIQDNLEVLGIYSSLHLDLPGWLQGHILNAAGGATKEDLVMPLYVPFGGSINLKDDDELLIQVIVGRAAFGVSLDPGVCYIEFNENKSIGYEMATPQVITQVVQANITKERFSLGEGVSKIVMLNLDQLALVPSVINSLSLSSDKLDLSLNFFDLLNRNRNVMFPAALNNDMTNANGRFPQTFVIYQNTDKSDHGLDHVTLDISFNSANVLASKNYICATRFKYDAETYVKGANRAQKHGIENAEKVLAS